ncbi:MAG: hypothetical protein FJ275_06825, partial [Planctomycetes bacterium]|nr:hypothetical protein [Planctomycetota bacterium]
MASGILASMPAPPHPHRDPIVHHDDRTGRAVIVAPRRGERPHGADLAAAHGGQGPASWCPFCAGNEDRTPPDVLRAPAAPAPWRARIIPNRYPFAEPAPAPLADGVASRPAHGVHEVVIESPRHDTSILSIDAATWSDGWQLVRRRLADLARRGDLAWGTVFKNSGPRAGASLDHAHSQLVAIDFLPPALQAEFAAAALRADPFADLLAEAHAAGRVVREAHGLVAIVPPVPRQPCETWIVPTSRQPQFHATGADTADALAHLTQDLVGRLARLLPGVDYNWWLHDAAWRADAAATAVVADRWHWHLEILPRASELAGFELA